MLRGVFISVTCAVLFLLPCLGIAQSGESSWWNGNPEESVAIDQSTIVAGRPLREVGIHKSEIDTFALRENVALSMADILTFNSGVFVKQYGRGSLATVSFRGTSASHTQVMWNGIKINSPMLGMTDFSTVPSCFIDRTTLLHGASSTEVAGGGLGGAVLLTTGSEVPQGFNFQYIQGVGSFSTYDEFLRLTYGGRRWNFSTRVSYGYSRNDFTYRNYNKKVLGEYPIDTNRCGALGDFHLLQEASRVTASGDHLYLGAWYMASRRGVPMLSVDYKSGAGYVNEQREHTLRSVARWERQRDDCRITVSGGYLTTRQNYDFARERGDGVSLRMVESISNVHTLFAKGDGRILVNDKLLLTGEIAGYQHFVESIDSSASCVARVGGGADSSRILGYRQARFEMLSHVSAKWSPTPRVGLSLSLREELYGSSFTPLVPALFADWLLSRRWNITAKASATRNWRVPTLNDLYFMPGGNSDLRPEKGISYDLGINAAPTMTGKAKLQGEVSWFDSYIDDWIVWIPTFKGYWTPKNIRRVHAYGIEAKGDGAVQFNRDLALAFNGNFSWTPSINQGDPTDWADEAIGRQLVYVPEFASSFNGRLMWRSWGFTYKWCWYSERFTTSDNDMNYKIGRIAPYIMNDIVIEKRFNTKSCAMSVKLAVNNIFDEAYESVLSRPMPGRNCELLLELRKR